MSAAKPDAAGAPSLSWARWRGARDALGQPDRLTLFTIFRARSDRVIAVGRLLLAVGALGVVLLDASHPPLSPLPVRLLLVSYFAFALAGAVAVWRTRVPRVRGTLVRHAVDIAVLAAVFLLNDGPSNPFSFFIPFVLLSGTLHWRWRGALWTALACAVALTPMMMTGTTVQIDLDTEATEDASVTVFMLVSAILLIWLGAHEEAVRADLLRLAQRVPPMPRDAQWPAAASLDYAAHVMGVPCAVLMWSDGEEPWTTVARWRDGSTLTERAPPFAYEPWVDPRLGAASVLCVPGAGECFVHLGEGRFTQCDDAAVVNRELAEEFGGRPVISVAFRIEDLSARLFFVDPPRVTLDQVAIGEIVSDRLRALFEQARLMRRLSEAAAAQQRVRIARDLHDGVLQALAGTALQLETLRPLVAGSDALQERIQLIQAMLADEQHELRAFVRELEPGRPPEPQRPVGVAAQFAGVLDRLRRQWGIDVAFRCEPGDLALPPAVAGELARMASEAVANAVRHGAAGRVEVAIRGGGDAAHLDVADDGCGFGIAGTLDRAAIARIGPRTLVARVQSVGGTLSIDDGPPWTRIAISLPVAA